jgi:hypothetical protein
MIDIGIEIFSETRSTDDLFELVFIDYTYNKFIKNTKILENNLELCKNFFIKEIFDTKNEKQLEDSYLKIEIRNFITKKIKSSIDYFFDDINKCFKSILYYDELIQIGDMNSFVKYIKGLNESLKELELYLVNVYVNQMDLYALSRIFRYFEIKKSNNHPRFVKNIYVYAGNYHIETYYEFIESLKGFNLITDIHPEYEDKSCITLNDVKLRISDLQSINKVK